jgi:hypothetical protein
LGLMLSLFILWWIWFIDRFPIFIDAASLFFFLR